MAEKKVMGFKKFSDIKGNKKQEMEEVQPGITPDTDSSRPMNPNLPNKGSKVEKMPSRKGIIPKDQNIDLGSELPEVEGEETSEKVEFIGKLAKFPKETKASKALNFLENVKISKSSIWYLLVEKQDNELQMVKYNNKQGFDMDKFVLELKGFYIKKWAKKDPKMAKLIESIQVSGKKEFSVIRNIPNVEVEEGKKLITIITEDLIKLLSK
jgi:hypothetical protein